jgi:hypothetical protein
MASQFYSKAVEALVYGNLDLLNDPVAVMLVDTSQYTPDLVNDASLLDVPESAILGEVTLDGKSYASGVYRADSAVIGSVTGDIGAVLLFTSQETKTDSLLVALVEAPELPAVAAEEDVTINWDPSGILIFN